MAVLQTQYSVAKKRQKSNPKIHKRAGNLKWVEIRLQKQLKKFGPVQVIVLFTQNRFTSLYNQRFQNFQQQVIVAADHDRKKTFAHITGCLSDAFFWIIMDASHHFQPLCKISDFHILFFTNAYFFATRLRLLTKLTKYFCHFFVTKVDF